MEWNTVDVIRAAGRMTGEDGLELDASGTVCCSDATQKCLLEVRQIGRISVSVQDHSGIYTLAFFSIGNLRDIKGIETHCCIGMPDVHINVRNRLAGLVIDNTDEHNHTNTLLEFPDIVSNELSRDI